MADETYYSILEISETASPSEVREAYRRLIREVHPDRLANAPEYWRRKAEEKAKEVNEAFAVLSDERRRRDYDFRVGIHREKHGTAGGESSASHTRSSDSYRSRSSPNSTHDAGPRTAPGSHQPHNASGPTTQANVPHVAVNVTFGGMTPGSRFFFAIILCLFAFSLAGAFCSSASVGTGVFTFLLSGVLFFGVVCLYQRPVRGVLARLNLKQPKQQLWTTVGTIAVLLCFAKVVYTAVGRAPDQQQSGGNNAEPGPGSTTTIPLAELHVTDVPEADTPARYLENGTEIRRRLRTGGLGELTVENGTSGDAVVNLVYAPTTKVIRSFYVRSGSSFTERGIRPGSYDVYFSAGTDWNPNLRRFNRDVSYVRFGKELQFTETPNQNNEIEYEKHEITLQPVIGGDVPSTPVDEATFDQLLNQQDAAGDQ